MPRNGEGFVAMKHRPENTLAPLTVALTLLLAPILPCVAASITNGDFSDPSDLAGWTSTGAVVGEPTGDFAQLETNGDFQRTLKQTFTLPGDASVLSFEFAFSIDTTSVPGASFPNSFTAYLESLGGALDIFFVDRDGAVPDPLDGNELTFGVLPIDVDLDPGITILGFVPVVGGTYYSGHISLPLPTAVLGQDATLYFDLYDEDYGGYSVAAVDNVSVDPAAVPAPATLILLLAGLAANIAGRNAAGGSAKKARPPRSINAAGRTFPLAPEQ
jgi:hypothetical protein